MSEPELDVGEWRYSPSSFELVRARDGARRRLPHRLGRLLARLVATAGEVVSREALIAAAWDRRGVADEVLSRSINALREALGDDARTPRYIETIPKRGYRLVAAVVPVASAPAVDLAASGRQHERRASRPTRGLLATFAAISVALAVAYALSTRSPPRRPDTVPLPALDVARERPLTSRAGWELGPALSHNGRLLAYSEIDTPTGPSRLVVGEIDGAGRHVLFESAAAISARPAFSPDGREIAYRNLVDDACAIHVASILTGEARRIAACASAAGGLDWSMDGRWIAYTAPAIDGGAPGIARVALDGGHVEPLTAPTLAQGPDVDPRFVPGADSISFSRGESSDRALQVVDLAPPHRVRVLFPGANLIHGHAWMPGAGALVLATDAPGYRALVLFDPPTLGSRVLGARGARFPAIGRSGLVVYEHAQYDANVWRSAFGAGDADEPLRLTTSSRYDASPALAPDGARFAFVSVRDGLESVWIGSTSAPSETRLPLPRERRMVRPHWHPDGESLIVTAYEGGSTRAYRHEIASGRTHALDALGEAFGAHDVRDGRAIVFARHEARGYALFISRGGAAPVPIDGAHGVDEFHLGDGFVAYTQLGAAGVVLHDLGSGTARVVLETVVGAGNRFDWSATDAFIDYAQRSGDTARLHRFDTRNGTTVALGEVDPDAVGATISVDPGGRFALFARVDELTVDLMAVPLR